jgi:formylglycine-generating enzyme required for sulfatase activity
MRDQFRRNMMKRFISWMCGFMAMIVLSACVSQSSISWDSELVVAGKLARAAQEESTYSTGAILDEESYSNASFLHPSGIRGGRGKPPESYSLKEFAPIPGNQGPLGACVSWASGYAARTIMESVSLDRKDKILSTKNAFSPLFLYLAIRELEMGNSEGDGARIESAMAMLSGYGAIRRSDFDDNDSLKFDDMEINLDDYRKYPVSEFGKILDIENSSPAFRIEQVKRFIIDDSPVIVGLAVTPSFARIKEVWRPEDAGETARDVGDMGHAVCIIGYDDTKYGGAFEVMNSWGEEWGIGGFGWIPYDVFGTYALQAWSFIDETESDKAQQYTAAVKINAGKGSNAIPVRLAGEGLYQARTALEPGTPLRFVLDNAESSEQSPVYAYIFSVAGNGENLTQIWPAVNSNAFLAPGQTTIQIPADNRQADGGDLTEINYVLLYSYTELDIPGFMGNFRKTAGPLLQRISKAAGKNFIPYNRIKYDFSSITGAAYFFSKEDIMGLVFSAGFGNKKIPLDMIRIKGGSFVMGSPASEQGREKDESQKKVEVRNFYIGAGVVTVGDFREFVESTNYKTTAEKTGYSMLFDISGELEKRKGMNWRNPVFTQEDNQPVVHISWFDAVEYCNWRSRKEGLSPVYRVRNGSVTIDEKANGYRLPAEAEWEYACRAGTTSAYNTGETIDNRMANFSDSFQFRMTPVGRYAPNAWGLYDTHGNTMEWCQDYYHEGTGIRSVRGSYWFSEKSQTRSAYRAAAAPGDSYAMIGFRLARNGS